MLKNFSTTPTPQPQESWLKLSDEDRFELIQVETKKLKFDSIEPVAVHANGQIFIRLSAQVGVSERGMMLLDYEELLKKNIDEAINVWCEPLGDKNSLRNLRGIQIKSQKE